jgi:formylglycine-generating enzyme required for sulfatase activity
MKKLFISYRSSDAPKVDKIARDLALLRFDDGTPRYTTWQDKKNLPPASPHWWDAIVDAIIDCDVFVFNMSKVSLQSAVCLAELDYAHKRNRPIIPVVLEGEFFLDPQSGKYNIDYWDLVPEWLRDVQFLWYLGTDFYSSFQIAIELFERNWPRDINAPRPLNPDSKSIHANNHALYAAACDYAERLAFADAEKHFDALVRRNDADYADVAAEWLELIRLYAELIEIDESRNARFLFKNKWQTYQALFPKVFLDEDGIFDPKNFGKQNVTEVPHVVQTVLQAVQPQPVETKQQVIVTTKPDSLSLMPAPFDWIEIPKQGYSIAKYPVTNAQFRKFIEAEGYKNQQWWTQAGWKVREEGWHHDGGWKPSGTPWTEPRYWRDSKWNGDTQPVVGVSWYESVAFCLWLSEVTGEKIMLPTEEQWQYAAQGADGRIYAWGPKWDASRCNNNVDQKGVGKTTPVTQYEGKGDSPFGVVDMAGNVWEWCLTDYQNKTNDINSEATYRVLRGGSWVNSSSDFFRCDSRDDWYPHYGFIINGFRVSRFN